MSRNYHRRHVKDARRKSTTLPVFLTELSEEGDGEMAVGNAARRRLSVSVNANRRLSTVSQMFLPHGNEFHRQEYVPPVGVEAIDPVVMFVQQMEGDGSEDGESDSRVSHSRRLSTISQLYEPMKDAEDEKEKRPRGRERTLLFIMEPLLTACLLFPIGSLFWQCGWNLVLIFLNVLNRYPLNLHLEDIPLADDEEEEPQRPYAWLSLFVPYLVSQLFLLGYYLCQNLIYNGLKRQPWLLTGILLKVYIFVLATVYIVQWETMWSVWDEFAPTDWYFDFTLSVCSLLALIVTVGHSSDLVCSPFIVTYDSLESCVHLGSPLLTREMSPWKVNLLNYILYEWIISNLSIITWRGFYHFLDYFFFPDSLPLSAGLSLAIGYLLYFPLMYFQTYLEELNLKYGFWTFVSINFPQFYRNSRHLLAFVSCVFAWRGWWMIFDGYINIFDERYQTYLLLYFLSFLFLSAIQTASSTNGPLSHVEDANQYFPLYPHSYLSTLYRKVSRLKSEDEGENTKL